MSLSFPVCVNSQLSVELETGGIWQNRNDVQIPSETGTLVEIDQINARPFLYYRLESYYRMNKRHALRLVYAPFDVEVTGRADKEVLFNGQKFSKTEDLTVGYRFNSYRLTYLYGLWGFRRHQINLGLTAKIRDAKIVFSQSNISRSYDNIGFVPLLYFEYQKALGINWNLNLTFDAAAASQGRAIDVALKLRRLIGKGSEFGFRYTQSGGRGR